MFLRRAKATRLVSVYLLFTVSLLMVPKADIPETPFDEANTPTNEMVIVKAASLPEYTRAIIASVTAMFAESRKIPVAEFSLVYAGQLTDARRFQELFCSLLC